MSPNNYGVIEGFMLRHVDGSIWVVKGCIHPSDGYVAIPRYVEGVKLKKLRDSLDYVLRYYRHYMRYLPEVGWVVPVVPLHDVREILNPMEVPSRLKGLGSRLVKATLEMLELIIDGCQCVAGVSGSLCGGYFSDSSDIDIVVYSNHLRCYNLIQRLRNEGVLKPMDLDTAFMELISVSEVVDLRMAAMICKRNLQGIYNGFKYTIRLVKCDPVIKLRDYVVVPNTEAVIRIDDDAMAYTTPAIYVGEVLTSATHEYDFHLVKMVTHRIRYSELRRGTILSVANTPLYLTRDGPLVNLDIPDTKIYLLHTV